MSLSGRVGTVWRVRGNGGEGVSTGQESPFTHGKGRHENTRVDTNVDNHVITDIKICNVFTTLKMKIKTSPQRV